MTHDMIILAYYCAVIFCVSITIYIAAISEMRERDKSAETDICSEWLIVFTLFIAASVAALSVIKILQIIGYLALTSS